MKKHLFIAAGVCLLILIAIFAFSQQWTQQVKVTVPFEFVVGNTVLPAGDYWVSTSMRSSSVLMLTNTRTKAQAITSNINIGVNAGGYNESSSLVFVLDAGGRHVLHQIWIAGQSHGHNIVHEKGLPEPR